MYLFHSVDLWKESYIWAMRILSALLFLGALLLHSGLHSQSLSFSQAKLVSQTETVPSGRVWKVVNILPSARLTTTTFSSGGSTRDFIITINGQTVYYLSAESRGNLNGNGQTGITSVTESIGEAPIWLPAGTTLAAGTNVHSVSVLEFIVNP